MANSKLHIICGNCGCNDEFTYRISYDDVFIYCNNCSTLHLLRKTVKEED